MIRSYDHFEQMEDNLEDNLPPREIGDCYCAAYELPEPRQARVISLLDAVENEDFWRYPRKLQAVTMLQRRKEFGVTQKDISVVLGVAPSSICKYKYVFSSTQKTSSRPAESQVKFLRFPHIENFIHEQWTKGRSLPLGVLLEFLADKHHVFVTRKCLREYMTTHGYPYVMGIPTDALRVAVPHAHLEHFFMRELPEALRGVHPGLVYNMDEMGAERYADAKHVKVFVPEEHERGEGMPIGVPRSSRRITLVVCIVLDGSRLKPAVITRNATVNSLLFERGYDSENVALYTTKNSFVTGDVCGQWL